MTYSAVSEVITPAASHNLTTLSNIQLILNEDNDATEILTLFLQQATADIESYCDRVFVSEVMRDTFSVWGRPMTLLLARGPVTAISSITDGVATLTSSDYQISKSGREIRRLDGSGGLSVWIGPTVVVNYTAGFVLPGNSNPTLPADVEAAAIDLVRLAWQGRSRNPSIRSESVDNVYSVTYASSDSGGLLTQDVTGRLNRYRYHNA